MYLIKKYKVNLVLLAILATLSCQKTDPVTSEKVLIETNPQVKSRKAADEGKGVFGDILKGGGKSSGTVVDFANSNILWRATLKTLDFMPLMNVDYSGGVIIYDWYSSEERPDEQIKIAVRFLNTELRSDSLQIISHKKICINNDKCKTIKLDENFNREVKDTIITAARKSKIEEEKNKKSN
jgi:hypothetical protein